MENAFHFLEENFFFPTGGKAFSFPELREELSRSVIRRRLQSCHPAKLKYLHGQKANQRVLELAFQSMLPTIQDLGQFISKLHEDFENFLVTSMAGFQGPVMLDSLYVDLGDVHPNGHSTCILEHAGAKYVYRPRALSYERKLTEIFLELKELGIEVQQSYYGKTFTVSRFIERSADIVQNIGSDVRKLVFTQYIASLCGLTDLHFENFLHGPVGLVPIDLEVYQEATTELLEMKACVFPEYSYTEKKDRLDISPVGVLLEHSGFTYEQIRPHLSEALRELEGYADRIHEVAYAHLLPELSYRKVYRQTKDYVSTIEYIDDFYFEGKDKQQALRTLLEAKSPLHCQEILSEEIDALVKGYVPVFYRQIEKDSVLFKRLTERLEDQSKSSRAISYCSEYMKNSVLASYLNREDHQQELSQAGLGFDVDISMAEEANTLRTIAARIYDETLSQVSSHIEAGFVGEDLPALEQIPYSTTGTASELGTGFYGGYDGVLSFLSAGAVTLGSHTAQVRQLVRQRATTLLKKQERAQSFSSLVDGHSSALFGTVFSLLLLGERQLAKKLAKQFLTSAPDLESFNEHDGDIFLGKAGFLFAASRIISAFPELDPGKNFRQNFEKFLHFLSDDHLTGAVKNISFAHGDAGLLFLLAELAKSFPDSKYAALIEALIERIYHSYLEHGGRFKDYRSEESFNLQTYCSGAAGILLSLSRIESNTLSKPTTEKLMEMKASLHEILSSDEHRALDGCCSGLSYFLSPDFPEELQCKLHFPIRKGYFRLFKGSSGLGYLLLRKIAPLPDIFAFELPAVERDTSYEI